MRNNEFLNKSKKISKELKELSSKLENDGVKGFHDKARAEINKKYGKFWRENLRIEDVNANGESFVKMSYY